MRISILMLFIVTMLTACNETSAANESVNGGTTPAGDVRTIAVTETSVSYFNSGFSGAYFTQYSTIAWAFEQQRAALVVSYPRDDSFSPTAKLFLFEADVDKALITGWVTSYNSDGVFPGKELEPTDKIDLTISHDVDSSGESLMHDDYGAYDRYEVTFTVDEASQNEKFSLTGFTGTSHISIFLEFPED